MEFDILVDVDGSLEWQNARYLLQQQKQQKNSFPHQAQCELPSPELSYQFALWELRELETAICLFVSLIS